MASEGFWSKLRSWLLRSQHRDDYQPPLDSEGFIQQEQEQAGQPAGNAVTVKKLSDKDKAQVLEDLQDGFNNLIKQLEGINSHLDRQTAQHEKFVSNIDKFADILATLPDSVENQKQVTSEMLEQLRNNAAGQQQFMETVRKIPEESAKQTESLANIDHQLAAAADTDVQMAENFNKFNSTLGQLNQSAHNQSESIRQMNKTFAASDRYLKYMVGKQNRRFAVIFFSSLIFCLVVIAVLVGIIIYLAR